MNTSRHVKIRHWWRQAAGTCRLFLNPLLIRFLVMGIMGLFVTSSSANTADDDWVWAAQHAVGSPLPAFTTNDSQGKKQTLSALLGKQGTLIFFNRSADW